MFVQLHQFLDTVFQRKALLGFFIVHFIENIHPVAKWMFPLAEKAMAVEDFKDVAYFEPFYLKEFVASTPKKLL